jgi:hypothetical protein
MSDESRGIYKKYYVERLNDNQHKHDGCTYFVLDLQHDKFSRPALRAYAKACEKKFPQLAKDIRWMLLFPRENSVVTTSSAATVKFEREARRESA